MNKFREFTEIYAVNYKSFVKEFFLYLFAFSEKKTQKPKMKTSHILLLVVVVFASTLFLVSAGENFYCQVKYRVGIIKTGQKTTRL